MTNPKRSQLLRVLGQAFFDDPAARYVVGRTPIRSVEPLMDSLVRYGERYGNVSTTGDPVTGGAVWVPPEAGDPTFFKLIRAGMLRLLFTIGPSACTRMLRLIQQVEIERRQIPGSFIHLVLLGVDPALQRKGVGTALLSQLFHVSAQRNTPIYLETVTEQNVLYYERHGFEVRRTLKPSDGAPTFWLMTRAVPRS